MMMIHRMTLKTAVTWSITPLKLKSFLSAHSHIGWRTHAGTN